MLSALVIEFLFFVARESRFISFFFLLVSSTNIEKEEQVALKMFILFDYDLPNFYNRR